MGLAIVKMPYEPDLSVNHCYLRGNPKFGKKKHVKNWLKAFRVKLNNIFRDNKPTTAAIEVDLRITVPRRRGRLPDTTNFQKVLLDVVAAATGFDDWTFTGHCYPARRVKAGEDPTITITIRW